LFIAWDTFSNSKLTNHSESRRPPQKADLFDAKRMEKTAGVTVKSVSPPIFG
jgi:hypothetical protein